MVPAGKIWNLTLPPVSKSACLEKPCANCSRCTPPGQDVAVRMVCCAPAGAALRSIAVAAAPAAASSRLSSKSSLNTNVRVVVVIASWSSPTPPRQSAASRCAWQERSMAPAHAPASKRGCLEMLARAAVLCRGQRSYPEGSSAEGRKMLQYHVFTEYPAPERKRPASCAAERAETGDALLTSATAYGAAQLYFDQHVAVLDVHRKGLGDVGPLGQRLAVFDRDRIGADLYALRIEIGLARCACRIPSRATRSAAVRRRASAGRRRAPARSAARRRRPCPAARPRAGSG